MDAIEKLTQGNTLEKGNEIGTNVWEAAYNLRQVVMKEIRDFGKAAKEIEAYNRMD
ncbi:hypothetical protein A2U01_0081939, partial [Trifolium medium]|nr:hypothetical protein [Trifolium medium]